jgi:4-oxalocrotonate tautomerase family enzyme
MPEIILELAEGRTLEQKRTIVKEFTDTLVRVCGVDREAVVVIIHENPRTDKTNRLTTTGSQASESSPSDLQRNLVAAGA